MLRRLRERLYISIAWALPRELVWWCYIRVMSHATTGKFSRTHPAGVTFDVAAKRWEQRN